MAKWVEALPIKLEDLSLCLVHVMEGDNGHPQLLPEFHTPQMNKKHSCTP